MAKARRTTHRSTAGKKLYATQFFAQLAMADADFAYGEALKLPEKERHAAMGHVAAGIATKDLERAREILDSLPASNFQTADLVLGAFRGKLDDEPT